MEKATIVGIVSIPLGNRTATAILFDNLRWMIDFRGEDQHYEIGDTAIFIHNAYTEDSGPGSSKERGEPGRTPRAIRKLH